MGSLYKHKYRTLRLENTAIPESKQFSGNVFFIQIQVKEYVVNKCLQNERIKDKGVKEFLRPIRVKNIVIRKDLLLSKDCKTLAFLSNFLRGMGVPAHALHCTTEAIAGFGKTMVDSNPDQDVLTMGFDFSSYITEVTDEN